MYFPNSLSIRTVGTVHYFTHTIPFPKIILEDHLMQVSSDIVALIANPPSTVTQELQSGNEIKIAILELAFIFNNAGHISALPIIEQLSKCHLKHLIHPMNHFRG